MTEYIITAAAGLLSGICASLGIGGGFVLLLYLTAIKNLPQLEAQLLNLCFFIPVALFAVILHIKNGMIEKRVLLFTIIGGIAGVFLGSAVSQYLSGEILKKLFAVFIFAIGLRELFSKEKK